jgi:Tol biopolymer transport system component
MFLPAGTRLGPYEILGPIGAGGMGEVYKARDTRLGREVAMKVLPVALSSDPERLKRFEREARSASSLNHPNIVTIYDVGSADGVSYIAMELVAGERLRAWLGEKALPLRQFLQIAAQVADGLARAHASGIVHRDLKPDNVMVTEDGQVKILDFGLAKLVQPEGSGEAATQVPTVSGATEPGIVLGTVGYMSPEQALGKPVDYRSDQFALGAILYEMATGRRAFQRGSAPQTLTAIIQDEPEPIAAVNPRVPAPVRWIVERCLAKDSRNRYASTEDLTRDLANVRDHLSEAIASAGTPELTQPVRARRWWIPAVVVAVVLAALGVVAWRLRQSDYFWRSPLAGARFTRLTDWEGSEVDAAISSDGKFVIFVSDRDGPFDAWVTQLGSDEFLNLSRGQFPGLLIDEVRNVGFTGDDAHAWIRRGPPDENAWVESVWVVPTMGGSPRPFLPDAVQVAWSPDKKRIVYHTNGDGDPIFVADGNGGNPKQIFVEKPGMHHHHLVWSPDGRFVYFVGGVPNLDTDIWRIPATGGTAERLTNHHARVSHPAFLYDGRLVYTATRPNGSGSGLYAMDVDRRIPHAVSFGLEEYVSVASSADGRRLVATVANPTSHVWSAPITDGVVDESAVRRFALPAVRAAAPRFGPDYLLFLSFKGGADSLWKSKDGSNVELWKGGEFSGIPAGPAVSPDGSLVAYLVRRGKRAGLYVMAADGTNPRPLAESLDVRDTPSWSPDGKWLAVVASEAPGQPLLKVPVAGGTPERLAEGIIYNPVWSPDGRFIVYSLARRGPWYQLKAVTPDKQPFRLPDIKVWRAGNRYRFLPDGKGLVIMREQGGGMRQQDFWLLDIATGRQRRLTNLRPGFAMKSFDVSPDGKQILFDRFRENSDVVLIDLPPG